METPQSVFVHFTQRTSDLMYIYQAFSSITFSQIVEQSIPVGTRLQKVLLSGSTIEVEGKPFDLPVAAPISIDQARIHQIDILPSLIQTLKALSDRLHISQTASLDWCISCWARIQGCDLVCVSPTGNRLPLTWEL